MGRCYREQQEVWFEVYRVVNVKIMGLWSVITQCHNPADNSPHNWSFTKWLKFFHLMTPSQSHRLQPCQITGWDKWKTERVMKGKDANLHQPKENYKIKRFSGC